MPDCVCAGAVVAKAQIPLHDAEKALDAVAIATAKPAAVLPDGAWQVEDTTLTGLLSGRHLRTLYVSLLC